MAEIDDSPLTTAVGQGPQKSLNHVVVDGNPIPRITSIKVP